MFKRNMALVFAFTTFAFISSILLYAQTAAPLPTTEPKVSEEQVNDGNIQLMRQDVRSQRKKIVAANFPLRETEATKFWPLYDRYIGETIKVNDVRFALIKEYGKNYQATTDEQANSIIKTMVVPRSGQCSVTSEIYSGFEKIISPKKTAMFFQIAAGSA